jgi:hypothetical protein
MQLLTTSARCVIVLGLTAWPFRISSAQTVTAIPTYKVDSSLTLVDVIAEQTSAKQRRIVPALTRNDFRVFDDGHEMPVSSFDRGSNYSARPIALWLIVQCDLAFPKSWASMFLRGKAKYLRPALANLDKNDAIGVAHWCDDGTSVIDLPPGHDPDAALNKVEWVLKHVESGDNPSGELAMQKMVEMVLNNTCQTIPLRLPVFLFLYGDHSGTVADQANRILNDMLQTSGIAFGLSDNGYHFDPKTMFAGGKIFYLAHYYSQGTGGQFYSKTDPKLFSADLDYILLQLHFRYTLGFRPQQLDGKRHRLKVELTEEAKKQFPSTQLRFRPEYIPVATNPPRAVR